LRLARLSLIHAGNSAPVVYAFPKGSSLKIVRLTISNFRGIKHAELHFDGHTLLVGQNNVGKSTICEALDLVLGPDRASRFPPVEEFDFHNAHYLTAPDKEEDPPTTIPIRIEVILVDLNAEIENRCGTHTEYWSVAEKRLLKEGEVDQANPPAVVTCLRLETIANYSIEEDEFEAATYFSHPLNLDGELSVVRKDIKRMFGFIYLRALRTGSRALSLERGSLLDLILRAKGVKTGLWEKAITRLKDLDIGDDAAELDDILQEIETRLGRYIPTNAHGRATKLHVSQLTREHLRKTMSFFIAMSKGQEHVPFQQAGTGTLNTLVLALLSFLADLKASSIIFAMEEPEIAVPPHTQRRIADYLLQYTTQAFVTSHSPYVIERFEPSQTLVLARDAHATLTSKRVSDASGLKDQDYKRFARRGLTECMLGKGVIVVEGVTELYALPVIARQLEQACGLFIQPLDISGVAFYDADGESNMVKFGTFFKELGLKTFSFYDYLARTPEDKKKLTDAYDIDGEHKYGGFEDMLVAEVPPPRLWTFLEDLRDSGDNGKFIIPAQRPVDEVVKQLARTALGGKKGAGWAARLLEQCPTEDLPKTVTSFLLQVYGVFLPPAAAPKPPAAPAIPAPPKPPIPVPAMPAVASPAKPAVQAPPNPAG
jgi:putative ATP-dependent endonuclease of OLD family